jgi:hypothetical protein
LIYLGQATGHRPSNGATDIGMMRDVADEGDELAVHEGWRSGGSAQSNFRTFAPSLASFRELAPGSRAERRTAKASSALLQAIVVQNRFYRSPPNRLPTGRDPFPGPRSPRSYCRLWRHESGTYVRFGLEAVGGIGHFFPEGLARGAKQQAQRQEPLLQRQLRLEVDSPVKQPQTKERLFPLFSFENA